MACIFTSDASELSQSKVDSVVLGNDHMQAVMNTVLDGLIIINHAGLIQSFNMSAERIFGYAESEVMGLNINILMPEPYHTEHDTYLSHYLSTGDKKVIGIGREVSGKRKSGDVFPMELGVNEMQLNGERMFVGTIRDISARKAYETKLKEEAERMAAVMNTVLDGLITIDARGIIQTFNPASVRIFGYEAQEVVGKNISVLMPESYQIEHDGYLQNYLQTGNRKVIGIGREVSGKRKDGSVFPLELGVNEMQFNGERMFVGTVRDISERKEAEEHRRRLMDSLMKSNSELERFAYVASHDMQEPLRMITNFSEIISQDYAERLDETGLEYLGLVCDAGERMRNMVDDLLEYARVGNESIAMAAVDAQKEIVHVLANLGGLIRERKAEVSYDPLPVFHGNAVQFMRLMQNLVTNGIKYQTKDNIPQIHISAEEQGNMWCFTVKDNGVGISEQFVEQVFQPFRRLHGWCEEKGTGIGLAVCRRIIENHGGKIWVTSVHGKGSEFHFTLSKVIANISEGVWQQT
jgi:two-component system, LuxR family, sensor kinase FixL